MVTCWVSTPNVYQERSGCGSGGFQCPKGPGGGDETSWSNDAMVLLVVVMMRMRMMTTMVMMTMMEDNGDGHGDGNDSDDVIRSSLMMIW